MLRPQAEGPIFKLECFEPSKDLRSFVDCYWIVRWDLRERAPYPQETLPHPSVNLAIELGRSAVYGVVKQRFMALLEGQGEVASVKFRPGAFALFTDTAMVRLTGRVIPLREFVGRAASLSLERSVLSASTPLRRVALLEAFLRSRQPARDEIADLASRATELILSCRDITSVEELANRCAVSVRALQRIFRRYVGVGPKWVIRRARVQDAAARVATGERVNWARLANELGYFDQTHLIKDFRAQIGMPPAAYAASCVMNQHASADAPPTVALARSGLGA